MVIFLFSEVVGGADFGVRRLDAALDFLERLNPKRRQAAALQNTGIKDPAARGVPHGRRAPVAPPPPGSHCGPRPPWWPATPSRSSRQPRTGLPSATAAAGASGPRRERR